MKTCISFVVLMSLICFNATADTINGITPELNFDNNYEPSAKMIFGSEYLVFVPESISFNVGSRLGFAQKKKFEKALEIMEEVMNSERFKNLVLSYQRQVGVDENGKPIFERSYQKSYLWKDPSQRLTNEDVYRILMKGDEKMRPNTFGEMNFNSRLKACRFYMRWHTWCRAVIGSTSPYNSKMITLNWKFYSKTETHEMVNNMVHEWIHLLGFLHGSENMRQEVPYVVGGIAGLVAKEILENK